MAIREKEETPKAVYKKALALFECQVCGTCCRGEGGIYLQEKEIEAITGYLRLPRDRFLQKYCLGKNGKIYIHVKEDGFCHFAREGKCQIHPVKPTPCRQWPFFKPMLTDQPNWEVARNSCPALAPYRSLEDYLEGIRSD
jgi:Fe-S-cluster containining protein